MRVAPRVRPGLWLGLGILVAVVVACSSDSGADVTVRMLDNSFDPPLIEIQPGQSVEFVNVGLAPHNAVAADGSWSTEDSFGSLAMLEDDSTVLTFEEEGSYAFFCTFHATQDADGEWTGMTGTLVVGDAEAETDDEPTSSAAPKEWTGATRDVPDDYPTIQSAVDAADPGDLVLIGPGVYKESVTVTTPGLTLRGTDRNEVILDGELTRENGIFVSGADGVAIENITARNYITNGFFWNGVRGYRGSYLTAIDNRVYGIYPFDSVDGLIEHSYASGSEDGGFYIGQCNPCDAVLTNSVAEHNGMAYSGTNSSTNIYIVNNVFRFNQGGVVPNTLDSELYPPVRNVYVGGNLIHDTGRSTDEVPFNRVAWATRGNGVALFGSVGSTVEKNLIINSSSSGISVYSMIDERIWPSRDNVVRENVILGSGRADVAFGGPGANGSCTEGENGSTRIPIHTRLTARCGGLVLPMYWGLVGTSEPLGRWIEMSLGTVESIPHGAAVDPTLDFESLPVDAPVVPAVNVFDRYGFDPASVTVPGMPDGVAENRRHLTILGIDFTTGIWPILSGLVMSWVPLFAWVLGGIWALRRAWRRQAGVIEKIIWTVLVVGLPVLGVVLFGLLGNRDAGALRRTVTVLGSVVLWLGAVFGLFYPLLFL